MKELPLLPLTLPVPVDQPTFAGFPRCPALDELDADIAIIGVPYGIPSNMEGSRSPSSAAPAVVREHSQRFARFSGHYDVDFGGEILAGKPIRIVDCGDVAMVPGQFAANSAVATSAIQTILRHGAIPIVLGGDDSIPIPVLRAYRDMGSVCVVQIDAHLDFRDEVNGVTEGLSSTMRRASEMPWVSGIAQIGLRGIGSAREQEFADARAFGAVHITAAEIHRDGIEPALARIPDADRYFITLDIDGLDPSIAPGVIAPAFGGLTYYQAFDLIRGVAARGPIVGFDIVEVVPELDVRNLTSLLAARLVMVMIGSIARNGQLDE